jgi:hypothetical protein
MGKIETFNFKTLTVTADIHADGDVYVKGKDKKFHYIGCLGESSFGEVPDEYYLKIKKLI